MQLISSMILLLYAKRSNFQCLIYIVFQLVSFKAIAFRNNVRKTLFPVLAGFVADSLSIAGLFIGSIHFTPSVSLTLSLSIFWLTLLSRIFLNEICKRWKERAERWGGWKPNTNWHVIWSNRAMSKFRFECAIILQFLDGPLRFFSMKHFRFAILYDY